MNNLDEIHRILEKNNYLYDNDWRYENKSWSAYTRRFEIKENFIVILINDKCKVVHYNKSNILEIWAGEIDNKFDVLNLLKYLNDYIKKQKITF